jgi:hypothetical protein
MTVYMRTEEGQLAAYSPDSVLPRKLRSLLKVIDGKTTLDVYAKSLHAFGDVHGVLKSLDMAGLIRPMSQLPPGATRSATESTSTGNSTPPWAPSERPSRMATGSFFRPPRSVDAPSTQAAFMPTRTATDSVQAYTDPAQNFARSQALARAIDSMSNFVLVHAPEQAFTVLKELDQITQLDQLAVTLGGYEQLIGHVGAPAQEHLALIKNLLREHM